MYNIIVRYILKMTKEDINNFAISKNINLSEEELNFTYNFIKKNYEQILNNPKLFKIERYKEHYSETNYQKISKVYQEYLQKYANYL